VSKDRPLRLIAAASIACAVPAQAQSGPFPGVRPGPNGTLQAYYLQNGCTVDYDARAERRGHAGNCTGAQLNFADQAVDNYRRDSRLDYGDDALRGRPELPVMSVSEQGVISANFQRPVCVVYYSPRGRRIDATQLCRSEQVRRADRAARQWRRDRGR
jgi:hypothetical protein